MFMFIGTIAPLIVALIVGYLKLPADKSENVHISEPSRKQETLTMRNGGTPFDDPVMEEYRNAFLHSEPQQPTILASREKPTLDAVLEKMILNGEMDITISLPKDAKINVLGRDDWLLGKSKIRLKTHKTITQQKQKTLFPVDTQDKEKLTRRTL
jgi:hypothetical protein